MKRHIFLRSGVDWLFLFHSLVKLFDIHVITRTIKKYYLFVNKNSTVVELHYIFQPLDDQSGNFNCFNGQFQLLLIYCKFLPELKVLKFLSIVMIQSSSKSHQSKLLSIMCLEDMYSLLFRILYFCNFITQFKRNRCFISF